MAIEYEGNDPELKKLVDATNADIARAQSKLNRSISQMGIVADRTKELYKKSAKSLEDLDEADAKLRSLPYMHYWP